MMPMKLCLRQSTYVFEVLSRITLYDVHENDQNTYCWQYNTLIAKHFPAGNRDIVKDKILHHKKL